MRHSLKECGKCIVVDEIRKEECAIGIEERRNTVNFACGLS